MMGFGTLGSGAGGNSSSSTSNLSALAPPFTVDRLNPKPDSNPFSNYSDSPYPVESINHHPWQYARPSAPGPEIEADSTAINGVPPSNDYRFSAPVSANPSSVAWTFLNSAPQTTSSVFAYGCEVKPYYSPYVPPLVGEGSLLIEDEGSRYGVGHTSGLSEAAPQYNYSLFDVECGPRWADGLGFDDGKRAKRSDGGGSYTSEQENVGGLSYYINQLCEERSVPEKWNKLREDYNVAYQPFSKVSDGVSHTGPPCTELMEDKSSLEKHFSFTAHNSKKFVAASSSSYPESHPSAMPCEMQNNFLNYGSSFSQYAKCFKSVDTTLPGRASVVRTSPSVVIRPPPATNGNFKQSAASRKPACSENTDGVQGVAFDYTNPPKAKDLRFQLSSKFGENSFDMNVFNFSKQGNGLISSTSVKELSSPLHVKDSSDRKVKARLGSQLPDINVPHRFPMANDVPVINSVGDSSDIIDHHNTAVDSPCWKGAPSSQFSASDVEAGNTSPFKMNLDEHYIFGCEEHRNVGSMVDSDLVFSERIEGNVGKEKECARNGAALALERTLDTICSNKVHNMLDGAKDHVWVSPLTKSKGTGLSDGQDMPNNESNLLNNLMSVFDINSSDTKHLIGEEGVGMTVNDVSEGAAVAVHAAEKVLASPASQEDATEHAVVPDPKLNIAAMIKATHGLSELLQFHLSNDACTLEKHEMETLQHVITNLGSCLSKKVHVTSNPELNSNHLGVTCETLGESLNVRNHSFPGMKAEKSPIYSPLGIDIDFTENDDMTKAIKKVLEENFLMSKKLQPQALLFKNLWLEAEAKLCSVRYKARFDRMKIHMEEIEQKSSQESEHISEMTSRVYVSPDHATFPVLAQNACDIPSPNHTLLNVSKSSNSIHADDVEASVLSRFSILKSREVNMKPIDTEEEQKPETLNVDTDSVMARFDILKSREENSKPRGKCDEKQPQNRLSDDDAGSIMARFNILKSRENSQLIGMDEEKQPKMINCDFAGEKLKSKFDSNGVVAGYDTLNEYHLSAVKDSTIRSFTTSTIADENKSGSHDSSSSEWEHVLKEDYSWKNL